MKFSFLISALLLQILSVVNAAPNPAPLLPEVDPFYKPPQGYESLPHGTVLRTRKSPRKLRSIYLPINAKESWQFLVRTTDSFGNASYIVNTVIVPHNADPTKLVSYQFAEDSANITCSPSYSIQYGAEWFNALEMEVEMFFVATLLERGYYVVTPDYQGPHSAFTAGRVSGQATLDSLIAAYSTANVTGLSPDAKTVMWGYSGGTIASSWAAVLLDDYAPELKPHLLGAAVGGFVSNITATAEAVDGDLLAGLIPNAINGLQQEYPELDKLVKSHINPGKLESYDYATKTCVVGSVLHFLEQRFFTGDEPYFTDGWGVFKEPVVTAILDANTLALEDNNEYPHIPFFIYHGLLDHVVPHKDAQRAYDNWCKWGKAESIELNTGLASGHITEFAEGAPAALLWIEDRFAGKPTVKGCKDTTRLSNLFYPGVNRTLVEYIKGIEYSIFDKPLGPNGENLNSTDLERVKRSYYDL